MNRNFLSLSREKEWKSKRGKMEQPTKKKKKSSKEVKEKELSEERGWGWGKNLIISKTEEPYTPKSNTIPAAFNKCLFSFIFPQRRAPHSPPPTESKKYYMGVEQQEWQRWGGKGKGWKKYTPRRENTTKNKNDSRRTIPKLYANIYGFCARYVGTLALLKFPSSRTQWVERSGGEGPSIEKPANFSNNFVEIICRTGL